MLSTTQIDADLALDMMICRAGPTVLLSVKMRGLSLARASVAVFEWSTASPQVNGGANANNQVILWLAALPEHFRILSTIHWRCGQPAASNAVVKIEKQ
jgi:hypothetical protein